MYVKTVDDVIGTDRDVAGDGWRSRRLMLAREGAPYSVHETTLDPGVRLQFSYRSHRETVYCVEGRGAIEDLGSGRQRPLLPGSLYSVGIGDDHVVTTQTQMRLICIFDPPLIGDEEAD